MHSTKPLLERPLQKTLFCNILILSADSLHPAELPKTPLSQIITTAALQQLQHTSEGLLIYCKLGICVVEIVRSCVTPAINLIFLFHAE